MIIVYYPTVRYVKSKDFQKLWKMKIRDHKGIQGKAFDLCFYFSMLIMGYLIINILKDLYISIKGHIIEASSYKTLNNHREEKNAMRSDSQLRLPLPAWIPSTMIFIISLFNFVVHILMKRIFKTEMCSNQNGSKH